MYYASRSNHGTELTDAQMVSLAPAIGAKKPADHVSSKYNFVPTLDAVGILRDNGWRPVHAEQSMSRLDKKKETALHMIVFQRSGQEAQLTETDRAQVVLRNSHNAGSAFKLTCGVYRMVCSNGLWSGQEHMNSSHVHINFSPEEFEGSVMNLSERAAEFVPMIAQMKAIELTPDEQGVFALAAHHATYDKPQEAPMRPENLLWTRREEDEKPTLWTIWNKVQENRLKGGFRAVPMNAKNTWERRKVRPVKSIDGNVKINQALEMLALKMAELKAA